ncbi:MAG TPA: ATP-binding protein [Verrucomicrobiae bacterium]|nr:ATP-binding protein [Verrucomicrobiae bacterium]
MDIGRTPPANVADRASAIPLRALLDLTREGIAYVGADALVCAWNAPAAVLTGIPAPQALGRDVREIFVGGDAIVKVPFDGSVREMRIGVETAEGLRQLHAAVLAVDFDFATHGWLCSFGPERRHREIEQLKNEIVTAVSHELKTPIATIKAYATTLRFNPDAVAAERDEYLRVIDEQADRLTRAVDDLLLASRVEVDQLLRRRVRVPLDDVVDAALGALGFDQAAHPIERHTAGVAISGDPELLREIFRHLLDNAAKFSPPGTPIAVDGRCDEEAAVVEVRDRGIGIAEEHLPYLFERFYRVENELTAQAGGSGLGLFIVSALARAHGGSVAVASEPGRGSTFSLRLPVRNQ